MSSNLNYCEAKIGRRRQQLASIFINDPTRIKTIPMTIFQTKLFNEIHTKFHEVLLDEIYQKEIYLCLECKQFVARSGRHNRELERHLLSKKHMQNWSPSYTKRKQYSSNRYHSFTLPSNISTLSTGNPVDEVLSTTNEYMKDVSTSNQSTVNRERNHIDLFERKCEGDPLRSYQSGVNEPILMLPISNFGEPLKDLINEGISPESTISFIPESKIEGEPIVNPATPELWKSEECGSDDKSSSLQLPEVKSRFPPRMISPDRKQLETIYVQEIYNNDKESLQLCITIDNGTPKINLTKLWFNFLEHEWVSTNKPFLLSLPVWNVFVSALPSLKCKIDKLHISGMLFP